MGHHQHDLPRKNLESLRAPDRVVINGGVVV